MSFWLLFGFSQVLAKSNFQVVPQDSLSSDSTQVPLPVQEYEKSRQPTYESKDRPGNSILYPDASSPLILKNPNSLQLDVEVDTSLIIPLMNVLEIFIIGLRPV